MSPEVTERAAFVDDETRESSRIPDCDRVTNSPEPARARSACTG
jgi:hypothetical protein